MKKAILAVLFILPTTISAMAEYPFEGAWAYDCGIQGGDIVPIRISPNEISYYESQCTLDRVEPLGERGQIWSLSASCSGEGETWPRDFILALEPDGQGKPARLVELDLAFGSVQVHERCE